MAGSASGGTLGYYLHLVFGVRSSNIKVSQYSQLVTLDKPHIGFGSVCSGLAPGV